MLGSLDIKRIMEYGQVHKSHAEIKDQWQSYLVVQQVQADKQPFSSSSLMSFLQKRHSHFWENTMGSPLWGVKNWEKALVFRRNLQIAPPLSLLWGPGLRSLPLLSQSPMAKPPPSFISVWVEQRVELHLWRQVDNSGVALWLLTHILASFIRVLFVKHPCTSYHPWLYQLQDSTSVFHLRFDVWSLDQRLLNVLHRSPSQRS